MSLQKTSVLFVCMGNICRSPSAERVFRHLIEGEGLSSQFLVDSAGTHDYHIGGSPDPRAQSAALARGIDISMLVGRKVLPNDFLVFDYILVMDYDNLDDLISVRPDTATAVVDLLLNFTVEHYGRVVPDPYYGGVDGFDRVLDLIEKGSSSFLNSVQTRSRETKS